MLTSSIAGLRGNQAVGLYSLSKAGVAALARNLAVELDSHNVRTNAVLPGMIDTEFARTVSERPELTERRKAQAPLRRFGSADEVAAIVLYLASRRPGAFTTGQNLVAEGGTTVSDGS